MSAYDLILGHTFEVRANPMTVPWQEAVTIGADGAVLLKDGRIQDVGRASDMRSRYPQARITDHGDKLICPGFVDAHVHYPQTAIIASWGKQLIDWLNTYTFPEEIRLSDPDYAVEIADRYLDLTLAHGTTTVCSYATTHPVSVDAFSNLPQGAICASSRAKPAWIATRRRHFVIPQSAPMTKARHYWRNGMGAGVRNMRSPRGFLPHPPPHNSTLLARSGQSIQPA